MQMLGWGAVLGGLVISLMLGAMPEEMIIVGDGDVEKHDLAELYDGETRTFGQGEDAITATREGDSIVIKLPGRGGEIRTINCTIGEGSCYAFTSSDGDKNMFVLKNISEGEGEKKVEVIKLISGEGHEAHAGAMNWVSADHDVIVGSGDGRRAVVRVDSIGPQVMAFVGEDVTRLRCPEGDTTMTLDLEEDDDGPYYCPKHNIEMEEVEGILATDHRVIVIETDEDDD